MKLLGKYNDLIYSFKSFFFLLPFKHQTACQLSSSEIVSAVWSGCISSKSNCQSVFIIQYSVYLHMARKMLTIFYKLRHYPIVAPLHHAINTSQSPSLSPCPHYQTEHKEVRSCGSSFSLMLMHILSLLHTNVSWPRLAVCLSLDLHLLSGYWPQFNLTLVTAYRVIVLFIATPIFKTVNKSQYLQEEICLKRSSDVSVQGDCMRTIFERLNKLNVAGSLVWVTEY